MKTISEKPIMHGRRRVIVELDANEVLLAVNEDAYYELGEPMDDVMQGHILSKARLTCWCPIEQKWIT